MPATTAQPLRAPARPSTYQVTLMARVPQALADQAQAYAEAHQLDISTLVRAGLQWVLTQPPEAVRPHTPAPASDTAPAAAPPGLTRRIVRVLEAHPAGIDVAMVTEKVNTGRMPKGHRASRAQVDQCLRHLYRADQVDRLAHGLYTARQQALVPAAPADERALD